jgi:hypothetical protein
MSERAAPIEWKAEIVDHAAALEHYADHIDIRIALQKAADRDASRLKHQFRVPGVRLIQQPKEGNDYA